MRILILGHKGMLGSELMLRLSGAHSVAGRDVDAFDLTSEGDCRRVVQECSPEVVINAAAYTNVDGAESQKELAHRVNGEAVGQLGRLAARSGKWVLHFSTDFVFDGELDRPYVETDPPNPINEYGRSKLVGERALSQSGCSHCIVRLEWTYGTHGNNFVTKIVERARASGQVKVVNDQVGSPTATTDWMAGNALLAEICSTSPRRRVRPA